MQLSTMQTEHAPLTTKVPSGQVQLPTSALNICPVTEQVAWEQAPLLSVYPESQTEHVELFPI